MFELSMEEWLGCRQAEMQNWQQERARRSGDRKVACLEGGQPGCGGWLRGESRKAGRDTLQARWRLCLVRRSAITWCFL